jgi:hypothetical protein
MLLWLSNQEAKALQASYGVQASRNCGQVFNHLLVLDDGILPPWFCIYCKTSQLKAGFPSHWWLKLASVKADFDAGSQWAFLLVLGFLLVWVKPLITKFICYINMLGITVRV